MTPRTLVALAWIYQQAAEHRCEIEDDGAHCDACRQLEDTIRRDKVARTLEAP